MATTFAAVLYLSSCKSKKKLHAKMLSITMSRTQTTRPVTLFQNATDALRCVGMLDLVESDIRPAFILDRMELATENAITLVYCNLALVDLDSQKLLHTLVRNFGSDKNRIDVPGDFLRFRSWISKSHKNASSSFLYHQYNWRNVLVANRWSVISGMPANWEPKPIKLGHSTKSKDKPLKKLSTAKTSTFDWTCNPPVKLSPHAAWARSINWANTLLGPMSGWSSQLRSVTNLVMKDPHPAVVFWGPDLIMIYNEAQVELLGGFHPCMGVGARIALAPVWSRDYEPIIAQNLAGETVERANTSINLMRGGILQETFFSLKFIPVFDSEGVTVGHYESFAETTKEVISERRSESLLLLSEEVPRAPKSGSFWALATDVLSRNDKDIKFALLYSMEYSGSDTRSNMTRSSNSHQECILRGSFGLPDDCPAAPTRLDLQQNHGFAPYFRKAMFASNPIIVQFDEGYLTTEMVHGEQWRGVGGPCRMAAVCPISPTSTKDNILGYIVFGLNPHLPYDNDYRRFIMITSRLISTSLTSILLQEEEIHHRERAIAHAESAKFELNEQLLATQKEAERNVLKFQRFAERADIGIFIADMDGAYSYRNEAWYRILNTEKREMLFSEAWDAFVDDEYIKLGQEKLRKLVETKQHQSFELRLKRTWTVPAADGPCSEQQPVWILLSVYPELTDDGEVLEIVGCFLDISQQKWGEKLQATQALNAYESKRQLENFIDTTSHEMRNPLSAILQCADSIISSHKVLGGSVNCQPGHQSVFDATVDAAETIVQCSKHMKTIFDDVLTLSKLDSGLFAMTPVDVNLLSIARDAVKMFKGEAKAAGVSLKFRIEDSYQRFGVDFVSLDPTRVLQILINLITNAIKFTRLEETRHVAVSLGVSLERPVRNEDGLVTFLRSPAAEESQTLQADWEEGEIVYCIFSVQDTGRGLSDAEHELLFTRFSQASPRTHIDYGGSGLGLFISRRLTEMHGGAIGFVSKAKSGSTFSFYVKCRRSKESPQELSLESPKNLSIRTQVSVLSSRSRDEKDRPPTGGRKLSENKEAAAEIHVLIVEDNLVNQRVLTNQLRSIGMQVAVANHGGEALEYLRSTKYCITEGNSAKILSLILMDWEMPVMDGLTCIREIRKLQKQSVVHGHVPVIAVTANVRSEQVSEALKAGMDDVISKPFRIPELCACIQKTIARTLSL